jgi:hypothetical protein
MIVFNWKKGFVIIDGLDVEVWKGDVVTGDWRFWNGNGLCRKTYYGSMDMYDFESWRNKAKSWAIEEMFARKNKGGIGHSDSISNHLKNK